MKWTNDIKKQFLVYILCSDVDHGISVKTALSQEGFDTYLFPDGESLYGRLESAPPHLIVLLPQSLEVPLSEFVQHIVNLNSEIRFLPVCKMDEVRTMLGYRPYNFCEMVIEGEGWLQRLVWKADDVCKTLYLQYQNEQMYSLMEKTNKEAEMLRHDIKHAERRVESATGLSVQSEIQKYNGIKTKEEIIIAFQREIYHKRLSKNKKTASVYFRYLPTVHTFVATQSLGVEIEEIQGVGGKLTSEEIELLTHLQTQSQVSIPSGLKTIMREGFKVQNCIYKTIFVQDELDGFFVVWSIDSEIYPEDIENEFAFFMLMYERCHLVRKLAQIDVVDPVTEMPGLKSYEKHLMEEVSRSRRLQMPVGVLKLKLDQLDETTESIYNASGKYSKDGILRFVSSLIQNSSRVNDISSRTGENEFSIILPHTAYKGALVRAERLRRIVEVQTQKMFGLRVSISFGVSEYPSYCSSAEELNRSATQALEFVTSQGGNKVCLFQPESNFVPDFVVPSM